MRTEFFIAAGVIVGIAATIYRAPSIRQALSTVGDKFNNLHPEVRRRVPIVIEDANAAFAADGLSVGMFDGWRDVEQQREHIESGASFLSDELNSYHTWGLAADFVFITRWGTWTWLPDPDDPDNRAYVDPRWYQLGAIIERHGFEWGGRWRRFDGPHAQLPITRVATLRARYHDNPDGFLRSWRATV